LGLAVGRNRHGLGQALLHVVDLLECLRQLLVESDAARLGGGVVEIVEDLLCLAVEALAGAVALVGLLGDGAVGCKENGAGTAQTTEKG
jgi:hypothetical protein